MFKISYIQFEDSAYPLFLEDTETGYTAKDVLSVPGAYGEVCPDGGDGLFLYKFNGNIGSYKTELYGLVVSFAGEDAPRLDITANLSKMLSLPDTAKRTVLSKFSEEEQESLSAALGVIHFCESVKDDTKVCLPAKAFELLGEEAQASMMSTRHSFVLKAVDNQEIFQTAYNSKFGVMLPTLEEIHSSEGLTFSAMDVLRVCAPYRKEEHGGLAYSYNGIYHTPYFRVDQKLRGMIPNNLQWMNGYASNDTLEIQNYERHMYGNLKTLIASDVTRYVEEMVSGLFFMTPLGITVKKLCVTKDAEVARLLVEDLTTLGSMSDATHGTATCELSFEQVEELSAGGWYQPDVIRVLKQSIKLSPDYLKNLVQAQPKTTRIVETDNIPFVLSLGDLEKESLAEDLLGGGFISHAMSDFLLKLCIKAYQVNWGHTGATHALPGFVMQASIGDINEIMAQWVTNKAGKQPKADGNFAALYSGSYANASLNDDDLSDDSDSDAGEDDELFATFDYYVSTETVRKMMSGALNEDFFSTPTNAASTSEANIVEYWRKVDGEGKLSYFITSAYMQTCNPDVFIECFLRLMRWGEAKPKLLTLPSEMEVNMAFDLNSGLEVKNYAMVSESDLVKVNGCTYTYVSPLTAQIGSLESGEKIVGFHLQKDYGSVKKDYLASWNDIGEMASLGKLDVAELKMVTPLSLSSDKCASLSVFDKKVYELFVSDANISLSLEVKVPAKDLSDLALLVTPGILYSSEYLRALKNEYSLTLKDRQYDILRRYSEHVAIFYETEEVNISAVATSTALVDLALQFYNETNNKIVGSAKKEVNEAVAEKAILRMNLDGDSAKYDTSELAGKFTIISDVTMESKLPSIEFTEERMQGIALKVRNRLVMLMIEFPDKCVFCRKDILSEELRVVDHKIAHVQYKAVATLIDALAAGGSRVLNKKPAYLHETLKEFI